MVLWGLETGKARGDPALHKPSGLCSQREDFCRLKTCQPGQFMPKTESMDRIGSADLRWPSISDAVSFPHLLPHPAILHSGGQEFGVPNMLLGLVSCSHDFARLQESQVRTVARS